jgi:hypothetical protein
VTYTEIEAIHQLQGRTSLDHCVLQGLDLTGEPVPWAAIEVTSRTFFLGCRLRPGDETDLRARGAVFFPRFGELPFDPYRARLYDTAELLFGYDGQGFESATDRRSTWGFERTGRSSTRSPRPSTTTTWRMRSAISWTSR